VHTSDQTSRLLSSRATRSLLLLGLVLAVTMPTLWLRWQPALTTLPPKVAHTLALPATSSSGTPLATQAATQVRAKAAYGKLPLFFIENRGQVEGPAAFYLPARDKTVYFTPQGLTISLSEPRASARAPQLQPAAFRINEPHHQWTLKLDFIGANPHARLRGQDPAPTTVSYFKGAPTAWRTGLRTFSTLVYEDLWPGIDLLYSGAGQRLKYSFLVKPGADPGQIKLAWRGASKVALNRASELEIATPLGGFTDERPVSFQQINGRQIAVATSYQLDEHKSAIRNPQPAIAYGFRVGAYDRSQPLVIDPALLIYASYLGGSSDDYGNSLAVNSAGEAFITGTTYSSQATFPTGTGFDNSPNGESDVFVAKLNAAGTSLIYVTYLGGNKDDLGTGIAVDASGNAYITGIRAANSVGFPLVVAGSATTGFVAKLNATGTSLAYVCGLETFFDDKENYANGVAVDAQGNVYVAGSYFHFYYRHNAFVLRLNTLGTTSHFNLFYGTDDDYGHGVAVDGAGNVYLVGTTYSSDASTFLGPDQNYNGDQDAFIAKFDADLNRVYSGYLGGADKDGALAVTADAAGNAYVTGYTASTNFPTTAGLNTSFNGGYDAFIARINANGQTIQYAGYLGGSDDDSGTSIAVDGAGNAHVTGTTWSTDFPQVTPLSANHKGVTDAFVATFNAAGTALLYSGFHGGASEEEGHAVAVDSAGNVYLAGLTLSANAPVQNAIDPSYNGATDAFIAKLGGLAPNNTVSGTNVTPPLPPGSPAITFNNVGTPGTTTVEAIPPQSAGALPGGFTVSGLNVAYEIATTSSFSGPIVLTFDVPAWVTAAQFNALRILHNEGDSLIDRTILAPDAPAPDFATRKLSARVNSLSPFVLAGVLTAPAVTLSAVPAAPVLGQSVTLTAMVTNKGAPITKGAVVFKENGAVLAGPTPLNANGQASFSTANLSAGSHQIVLEYSGDGGLFLPSQGSGTVNVSCPAITLAPASLPNAQLAAAYSQMLSASPAGTSYSFAVTSGALPPGLNLSTGGLLSGTPSASGAFSFTVTATGFGVCSGTRTYTLLVSAICPALTLSPASLPGGTLGTAYNQTLTAEGAAGPYSFAVTAGALPGGVALNPATGALSGPPTASGSFTFTITATGTGGCTGSRAYTLTIACPTITLMPGTLPNAQAGVAYNQAVTASGAASGVVSYNVSTGNLPPGLTLNATSGALTGTPTATGTYSFTIRALSAGNCSGTQSYSLTVGCPTVTVNPVTLPNGSVGAAYNQSLSATPNGTYSLARVSGTLPTGLSLSAAGSLSGTPAVSGTFTFTVRATSFGACAGERSYTLIIGASCSTITLPALPNGTVGANYYGNLAGTTPSGSYTFTVESGALPPGLALDNLFAALVGKPTLAGTYNFTLKATRSNGCTGTRAYTIVIGGGSLLARRNDFDGDGKSDLVLRRAEEWLLTLSATGQTEVVRFGAASDLSGLGDYDGDGKTDLAVYRLADARWLLRLSSTGETVEQIVGADLDGDWLPVVADYDGDGRTDLALWESATARWHVQRSTDGKRLTWQFGAPGAVPVPADYDGDGRADLAIFQKEEARWRIQQSGDGAEVEQQFGHPKDEPLTGDFDGDGRADFGVWRTSEGAVYLNASATQQLARVRAGFVSAADDLLLGDYDGDGHYELAVWRAREGRWYVLPFSR
jgi:hypothetical protein